MAPRCDSLVWKAFWVTIGVAVVPSVLFGYAVLMTTFGFDQTSPVPQRQRLIALAGVIAVSAAVVVVLVVALTRRSWAPVAVIAVLVTVGAVCAAPPMWRRVTTIDVTDAGFHRSSYSQDPYDYVDLYVFNARSTPIVICVSARGECVTGKNLPARLRAPGRTIEARRRANLHWPKYLYGTFTLSIVSPLPDGARRSTEMSLPEPSYEVLSTSQILETWRAWGTAGLPRSPARAGGGGG